MTAGAVTMQGWLWIGSGAGVLAALLAIVAERRHSRRVDLDRVGWVPWVTVQFWAIGAALILAALALTQR